MRTRLLLPLIVFVSITVRADRILFVASNATDQITTLFTMNADGSDIQRVYTNAIRAWSPDLTGGHLTNAEIVFTDVTRPASNIFVVPLTGGAPVCLNNTNKANAARFHGPATLYYLRFISASGYQVWTINRDGTGERRVFSDAYSTFSIGTHSFSLHTTNIYLCSFSGGSQVFRGATNAATAASMVITTNRAGDRYNPSVSPDGLSIAYTADGGTGDHRVVISPNAHGTLQRLDIAPTYSGSPAWSPDSSWLAYVYAPASTFGSRPYVGWVCTVASNGAAQTNLTQGITTPFLGQSCCFPLVYNVIPEGSMLLAGLLVLAFTARAPRRT